MNKLHTTIFLLLISLNVFASEYFNSNDKKIYYDQNFSLEDTLQPLVDQYFYEGSTRWNPSFSKTSDYVIIKYSTNWYSITRFIFESENIVLDNGLQIGLSVQEAIKKVGTPSKVETNYDDTISLLSYGRLFPIIYNRVIPELELLIENNIIREIVVNRVLITLPNNIELIISDKWTSPGSELWRPDINLKSDHTFTYEHYENEYKTRNGYWRVIDNTELPMIEISANKEFSSSLKLLIYRESKTTLLIEVNGFCFYLNILI